MANTAQSPVTGRPSPVDITPGQLFINGKWRDAEGGKNMPTSSPTTEQIITTLATASPNDINEAIDAANVAFPKWAKLPGYARAKILNRIADLIEEHAHELAYREAVDMGKLYTDVMLVDVPHENIKAGTVWINTWHQYDPSAPFGGYKRSGYGREHGIEWFEDYTQHKTVWMDLD